MNLRKPLHTLSIVLLWIGGVDQAVLLGQSQEPVEATFRMVSSEKLSSVPAAGRRVVIEEEGQTRIGSISARHDRRILSVAGRPDLVLPHDLPVLVSRDGSVLLQWGDTRDLSHPVIVDLHWLSATGSPLGSRVGYYRADALVALSDDGFTAVVGTPVEGSHGEVISLFDPTATLLWERPVAAGREVRAEPVVASGGRRVVVRSTDSERPLEEHRLIILDGAGEELATLGSLGIVQKIVVLGGSDSLFVQGRDRYGLVDLATGALLWSKEGRLRLVGPEAAAASPASDLVYLLTAYRPGEHSGTYQWRLTALDAGSGDPVADWDLPGDRPGEAAEVFGRITEDRVEILSGEELFSVSLSR